MSTNRISGLISGMDIDSLVKKMVSGQQTKIDNKSKEIQILEWKQESYRETNLKLLALRNTVSDLKLPSTFTGKTVESSNETAVKATASSTATNGTQIIKVNSLYMGINRISTTELDEYQSTLAAQFGLSGTISFQLKGSDGVTNTYSFDTSSKDINDVVDAINGNSSSSGICAGYSSDGNRFVLATTAKGSDATIEIVADASSFLKTTLGLGMDVGTYTGTDASIDVDSATGIKFKSNQFTLNGVNFTLLKADETAAITVSNDVDTAVEKITKFIDAYNDALSNINTKLHQTRTYDKTNHCYKYLPLTDDEKEEMTDTQIEKWETLAKKGIMANESLLQTLAYNLRTAFNDILHNGDGVTINSGVTISSLSTLNTYASTLASQFGISGTVGFSLKGKDGVTNSYSFDTTTKDINDVVDAINTNRDASGIKATYSSTDNSFNLETTDKTQTDSFTIVTDGALFLKDTLKLNVSTGLQTPTTNLISGENVASMTYTSLSAIGISTSEYVSSSNENGKLSIDEDALREALEADSSAVSELFNTTQTINVYDDEGNITSQTDYSVGIALKAYDAITNNISLINTKAGSGDALYDGSNLGQEILRREEDVYEDEERLEDLEDFYYDKFQQMEQAIQKANQQSNSLANQFSNTSSSS